ncbi:MAG: DNA-3-methyladenine glycosylase I [Spirochaetes bacterium]|nr:DNA-3-methyladenine glycosylase I [Spirochaetota bacterium]
MKRCEWATKDEIYLQYHDEEWGTPVHDDNKQFEFLVLESAQAGLSWLTILKKRKNYRRAYDGFDPATVSRYDGKKVERLLTDKGIIRNRRKIESSINNAKRFLEVQNEYGSFDAYIWGFVGGRPVINRWTDPTEIPATTPLSDRISNDLKKRGFTFVGSTIVYAHLQAVGIVNDHLLSCFRYRELTGLSEA